MRQFEVDNTQKYTLLILNFFWVAYIERHFYGFIFIWQQSEKNIVAIFVYFETLASVKFEDEYNKAKLF